MSTSCHATLAARLDIKGSNTQYVLLQVVLINHDPAI